MSATRTITLTVDQARFFDEVREHGLINSTCPIGSRIIACLLGGVDWREAMGLGVYGVSVIEDKPATPTFIGEVEPCPCCGALPVDQVNRPTMEICRVEPVPPAIMDALKGFDDDYQTSEHHHPHHVLIPTAKFEAIRRAIASAQGALTND